MIRITRREAAAMLSELGVANTADTITLPRDFCLCGLLNCLGPVGKTHYEVAIQTLRDVEALLGLCDGAPGMNGADDCWQGGKK